MSTIAAGGEVRLLVYVQQGVGLGAVREPESCAQARRERAATLAKDRSETVKRWAQRRLAELRDTAPGLQTLWVVAQVGERS